MNLQSILLLSVVLLLAFAAAYHVRRSRRTSACQGCKLRRACPGRR